MFNYIITFFVENAKIWVGEMMLNGEKKEDGLISKKIRLD